MTSILMKKVYKFVWDKDSARNATITFIFNKDGKWEFNGCEYKCRCLSTPYDIDDWNFLRDLAVEILRLDKEAK